MLEQRPIVRKSLYGTGAFAFVFAAAMAGTAFMISGGFGSGEHAPADPPSYQIAASGAWSNVAPDAAAETPHAAVTPASLQVTPPAPAPAATQAALPDFPTTDNAPSSSDNTLAGDASNAQQPSSNDTDNNATPKSGV